MSCIAASNATISAVTNFILSGRLETDTGIFNAKEATNPALFALTNTSAESRHSFELGNIIAIWIRAANEMEWRESYPEVSENYPYSYNKSLRGRDAIKNNFPELCYCDSIEFHSVPQLLKSLDFLICNCSEKWEHMKTLTALRNQVAMIYIRSLPEYENAAWQ